MPKLSNVRTKPQMQQFQGHLLLRAVLGRAVEVAEKQGLNASPFTSGAMIGSAPTLGDDSTPQDLRTILVMPA